MNVKIKIIKYKLNHWEGASDKAKETVAKILLLIVLMFGASELIEANRMKLVYEQRGWASSDLKVEDNSHNMGDSKLSDSRLVQEPKAQEESTRLEADSHSVIATTYNPTEAQTDSDPFTMASGKRVYEGAVASNCHPIGTKIKIENEVFTVEDRMNKRYTKDCGTANERLDIFKFNKADNFKKIVKYAKV